MEPDSLQPKQFDPFDYENKIGNKIVFVRERCHCSRKRDHIFTKRVKKFCFCCSEISWHRGLVSIAVITLVFGFLQFLVYNLLVLRGSPSNVYSYFLFPYYTAFLYFELIFYTYIAVKLWVGIYKGDFKVITNFPWLLLVNYIFALFHIFEVIFYGPEIVASLVFSDYGMLIKGQHLKEEKVFFRERLIFYILSGAVLIFGFFFWTYIIILTLSWIDELKTAIENNEI